MDRVLLAGCGDLGSALGRRLAGEGVEVLGLRRDASGVPPPVHALAADLRDREGLAGALGSVPPPDAVVIAVTADERSAEAYRATYLHGTRNLRECLPAPPRRVLFVSSTSVYGQHDGSWVDERSPTAPGRDTGAVLLEAEEAARSFPGVSVCVRFGGIYGPGRTRLLERVRAGAATCPETPRYTNRIHRDDCVRVLHHLLHLAEPAPVYTAVDHDPVERRLLLEWLARRVGAPAPRPGPGRGGSGKRVRNDRLLASGLHLRYPTFREGYGAIIGGIR